MLDWLLQSDFNTSATAALWSMFVAVFSCIVLFMYTLALRLMNIVAGRRRVPLVARWRRIFASAAVSDVSAHTGPWPAIKASERSDVLGEWNRTRSAVWGEATDSLITLAEKLQFPQIARRMYHKRELGLKLLSIQTLGYLKDEQSWSLVMKALQSDNSALSITAAAALVEIDTKRALPILVPMILTRRDWLQTRVAMFLRSAGSVAISEHLRQAIVGADPGDQVRLLKFASLMETSITEEIADDLVRHSSHPGVIGAALELLGGYKDLPRLDDLAVHDVWFVRLRVAQALGRVGTKEHIPLLESMLEDSEWWVRYRAAQSITSLPFLGPNALNKMWQRQTDEYARDMLGQVLAEVGLQ